MEGLLPFAVWHLVESTGFALALAGTAQLLRLKSASVLCWVYRIALLKFGLPTIWFFGKVRETLQATGTNESIVFGPLQDAAARAAAAVSDVGAPIVQAKVGGVGFEAALGLSLALGLAWQVGIRLARGLRFHRRVVRGQMPFASREARVLRQCSRDAPEVKGTLVAAGPGIGLYGIFRPRIMARRPFLDGLSDGELATAFRHEVAHRIRRDNLWCVLAGAIACLFWFHPLVWALRKRMLFEMEKACDEQVISSGGDANGYVGCLLKAAAFSNQGESVGVVALSESYLKRRVRNIIEYQQEKVSKMKLFSVNCVVGILLLGSFGFSAVAGVKGGPLEDVRDGKSDTDEVAVLDRERMEAIIRERVEQQLAEAEASMKEHVERVMQEKQRLQEELQKNELQLNEIRERISQGERERRQEFQKMRTEAMVHVERAVEDLAKQRERLAKERERLQERQDRHRERLEARAGFDGPPSSDTAGREAVTEDSVYDLKDLDTIPKATFQVKPKYPPELKKAKIAGWVVVEWIITEKGSVEGVRAVESSQEAFEESATVAISKSKWKPGTVDGQAVKTRVRQKLEYNP